MHGKSKLAAVKLTAILLASAGLIWTNLSINITTGSIIGSVVFGVIILAVIFSKKIKQFVLWLWKSAAGKFAVMTVAAAVTAFVGFFLFLCVNMAAYTEKPSDNVKCVLVLGCRVMGETPSLMLGARLEAAIDLLEEFPQAVCVVSGGMGAGEDITEAEAMRRYLTARGIAPERILCEDKSTSTSENIAFSAELIRPLEVSGSELAIVTSGFHQYRADLIASRHGFDNAAHHSASTPKTALLNNLFREWAALAALYFGI